MPFDPENTIRLWDMTKDYRAKRLIEMVFLA